MKMIASFAIPKNFQQPRKVIVMNVFCFLHGGGNP